MYLEGFMWIWAFVLASIWVKPYFYWLIDYPIAVVICLVIYYYILKNKSAIDEKLSENYTDFLVALYLTYTIFLLTTLAAGVCVFLLFLGIE